MTQVMPEPISQGPVQPDGSVDVHFSDGSTTIMPLAAVASKGLPVVEPPAPSVAVTPPPSPSSVNLGGKQYNIDVPAPTQEQVVASEAASKVSPGFDPSQNAPIVIPTDQSSVGGGYVAPAAQGVVPPALAAIEEPARVGTSETQLRPGDPGAPPPPVNLFTKTHGGPGGITQAGRLGIQEFPQQSDAMRAAEEQGALGREAQGLGDLKASEDVFGGVDRAMEMHQEQAQIQRLRSEAMDHYRDQLQADAIEQSHEKLDPNAMFTGEGGGGKKFLAIIGMMLGGLTASQNGGHNMFESVMNAAIEKDLMRQKFDIDSRTQGRKSRQLALQVDIEKYGSEEAGLLKRRADMWDTVAHAAEGYRVAANGTKMQTDAEAMRDLSLKNASEDRLKLASFLAQNTIRPSAPGLKFNPQAYWEYIKNNPGGEKAFNERMKFNVQVPGINKDVAAAIALSGGSESEDIRKARMEAGFKEAGKISPIDEQTEKVGKMFQAAGISDAEKGLTRLEQMIAKYTANGGTIPGVGPIKNWVGDSAWTSWLLSDEGARMQQEITASLTSYINAKSGAAATAIELPRLMKSFMGPGTTPEGMMQTVTAMRQTLDMKTKDILASVNPEAANIFMTRRVRPMPGPSTNFDFSR